MEVNALKKKNKVIQIRISEVERDLIDNIYDNVEDFNLSLFFRQCLRDFCKEKNINSDRGIGSFMIR